MGVLACQSVTPVQPAPGTGVRPVIGPHEAVVRWAVLAVGHWAPHPVLLCTA